MTKKSRGQILGLILDKLKESPMSANELKEELNSNWDTIKNNIEILEELSLCEGKLEGKRKTVYFLKNNMYDKDARTWFGLPLSEKQATSTMKYFGSAKEAWQKFAGITPNKVQLEKTVFEMVQKNEDMEVPMGWYLYGPIALMRPEEELFLEPEPELVSLAKPFVNDLKKHKYSQSLIKHIYSKYDKKAHDNKIEFEETLIQGIQSSEDKTKAIIALSNILRGFNIPNSLFEKSAGYAQELLDAYISIVSKLLISNTPADINKHLREPISDSFNKLWTLITRIMFLDDMKNYVSEESVKNTSGRVFMDILRDVELSLDMLSGLDLKKEVKPNPTIAKYAGIAKD